MKLPYLSNLLIVICLAILMSGCSQSEKRKESIEGDIQQNWNPEKIGELTREQAFKECNEKSKTFGVRGQDKFSNWNSFMRTCMRDRGFTPTRPAP